MGNKKREALCSKPGESQENHFDVYGFCFTWYHILFIVIIIFIIIVMIIIS